MFTEQITQELAARMRLLVAYESPFATDVQAAINREAAQEFSDLSQLPTWASTLLGLAVGPAPAGMTSKVAAMHLALVTSAIESGHAQLFAMGNPGQARIPRGNPLGGRWIDMPGNIGRLLGGKGKGGKKRGGLIESMNRPGAGSHGKPQPLVESFDQLPEITLSPAEIRDLRASPFSGKHIDKDGVWSNERRALHAKIVDDFLKGIEPAPPGEAQVWFNGGGPGSGKGNFTSGGVDAGYPTTRSVNDLNGEIDFEGTPNPGAALIDPDSMKMQLPETKEYREMQRSQGDMSPTGEGGQWAQFSHEESSYLAKLTYAEAQRRNLNVVYDGTGMKIADKAQQAKDSGYSGIHANYMYVEPDQALTGAIERAQRIGRNVNPEMQAGQYKGMPAAMQKAIDSGLFSDVNLYDRNGVERGDTIPKIFEIVNGKVNVLDQAAYDRWLTSGTRTPDVSEYMAGYRAGRLKAFRAAMRAAAARESASITA